MKTEEQVLQVCEHLMRKQTVEDNLGSKKKKKTLQRVINFKRNNVISFILVEDLTGHVKQKIYRVERCPYV